MCYTQRTEIIRPVFVKITGLLFVKVTDINSVSTAVRLWLPRSNSMVDCQNITSAHDVARLQYPTPYNNTNSRIQDANISALNGTLIDLSPLRNRRRHPSAKTPNINTFPKYMSHSDKYTTISIHISKLPVTHVKDLNPRIHDSDKP